MTDRDHLDRCATEADAGDFADIDRSDPDAFMAFLKARNAYNALDDLALAAVLHTDMEPNDFDDGYGIERKNILWDVTIQSDGSKIYHFHFTVPPADIAELIEWAASVPNQGQYPALLTINAYSDCPPSPTSFSVRTNIYGKALALPFFQRWRV